MASEQETTVYMLGAGFSRAFSEMTGMEEKYPLMNDFMEGIDDDRYWGPSFPDDERKALVNWIDEHYECRKGINVEELMTMFELMKEGYLEAINYDEFEKQRILADKLIHALKNYIRWRLRIPIKIPVELENSYGKWVESSYGESIFVTFNYDSNFEDLYHQLSINYNFKYDLSNFLKKDNFGVYEKFEFDDFKNPPSSLFFYKLHGSLNWYRCSNNYCNQSVRVFSDYKPLSFKESKPVRERKIYIPKTFCPICASPMEFVIILPQIIKEIDKFPKLKLMWRFTAQALKLCKNIVSIGYSFPSNDTRTTYMMMRSLEGQVKNWTIVDLDPEKIKERLIEILPKHREQIENAVTHDGKDCVLDYLKTFSNGE